MKSTETIVDIIRHGEPVGGRMYRGNQVDHPLSKKGWQQMHTAISRQTLAAEADEFAWDLIISSPLLRCYDFAMALSQKLSIPLVSNVDLREISFGEWEGKTQEQIKATDPVLFREFQRDPINNRPMGAESLEAFNTRVLDALFAILNTHQGEKILLVSHAGILRTILVHVLSSPLKSRQSIRFPYAGMLRLIAADKQLRLELL